MSLDDQIIYALDELSPPVPTQDFARPGALPSEASNRLPPTMAIQRLRPTHRTMARAYLLGASQQDLCRAFNLTPGRISAIINSPLFQAEVARLEEKTEAKYTELHEELSEFASRALLIIGEQLHDPNPSPLRTRSAFDVLDRLGFRAKEAPQQSNSFNILNLIPSPGDDPREALKHIEQAQALLARKEIDDGSI